MKQKPTTIEPLFYRDGSPTLHYAAKRLAHVVDSNWELTTKEAQDMLDTISTAQDSHRELLEALEGVTQLAHAMFMAHRTGDFDSHTIDAAEAAIAKAKGENK